MPEYIPRFDLLVSVPNLGLASLAGNIDPNVCDVKIADLLPVRNKYNEYVLKLLKSYWPDLVGLSFMSFQYRSALKIAKIVKDYDKNIKVVAGGYHPTLMSDEMLESPKFQDIDFIIRGEGEETFRELTNALNNGTDYENIAGLSYRDAKGNHHNPPRELLDLKSIKLPNRDARLITKGFRGLGMPMDSVETSRGCTNKCKFCSISKMYGRSFRTYEIDRVIADIKDARDHGAKFIFICDDNVTLDVNRFEDICDAIISAKLNSINFFLQASVKGMSHSRKLVQKMADAGFKGAFLGIESTNESKLQMLQKTSTTSEDTVKAVKYLRDNGIMVAGGMIIGMPDDDEKALWETYQVAWDLKIDLPIFFILMPHLKTELREELLAQGMVEDVNEYYKHEGFSANVRTKYLSGKDLERIASEMYFKYLADIKYLRFSLLRKKFPFFFWKLALGQIPNILWDAVIINKDKDKHND